MLTSPRLSSPSEESFIPEEKVQAIMKLVENELRLREFGKEDIVVSIEHEKIKWQILVAKKGDQKQSKKIHLKALDLYVLDHNRILGEGAQGKVILGQHITSNKLVAVKIQKVNTPSFDYDLWIERRNLDLCNRLHACAKDLPADVKLEGLTSDQYEAEIAKMTVHYTVMTYVPGSCLRDFLYELDTTQPKDVPSFFVKKKELDIMTISRLAVYAIREMMGLHAVGLVHRDIKTDNFVVNKAGQLQEVTALKLIDLGTGILEGKEECKEDASTLGYMPPEYLRDVKERPNWDKACDVWQLGIVLGEILTKYNVQEGLKKYSQIQKEQDIKRHLTVDEIKGLMPDVFAPLPIKEEKEGKGSGIKSVEKIDENAKDELRYQLIKCIQKMTLIEREKRPINEALTDVAARLFSAYIKAGHLLSLKDPTQRLSEYKTLKRQNTVSELPKSVSFAASSVPKHQAASSSRSSRSQSSAPAKIQIIQPLIKPRRRTSTQISPNEADVFQQSAEEPSLSTEFAKMALADKSPEELLVEKLQHLQMSCELHSNHDQDDLGLDSVSDIMMFSLIGRRLKLAAESKGIEQQKHLECLEKITKKYVPSKNPMLNQQIESIKIALATRSSPMK